MGTVARQWVTVHGALPGAVADEVDSLARAATDVDGTEPLSEQPVLRLRSAPDGVVHVLARAADGPGLIGYAQLDLGPGPDGGPVGAELVVAPHARRAGLGAALLARVTGLATVPVRHDLAVWAHGDLPAARALAASAGLVVVRELWQMRLDLDAHPVAGRPDLPADVQLRAFEPGHDEHAWLTLNARAFAGHPEQGRMTLADLEAREHESWFDAAGLLLVERAGTLIGSVWTKVPAPGSEGELYVVGVDPAEQGHGLGRALTAVGVAHLAARGVRTVVLYTEADNARAVRTYTRAGFERSAVDVMFGNRADRAPMSETM